MCWSFRLGFPSNKSPKRSSSSEKNGRKTRAEGALHGVGRTVVAEVSEKRSSKESSRKRRSGDSTAPRSPRRERDDHSPRSHHHHDRSPRSRDESRTASHGQVPEMKRAAYPRSPTSSQEALLNPRPHRSQQTRHRHPKRSSQATLRGRGAKRDPPKHAGSKKKLQTQPSRGWSLFAPSPPKTPPKRDRSHRDYQTLESSPRSHRSSREYRSTTAASHPSPESLRSQTRHHPSRPHEQQTPTSRPARSRTPNTAARRLPDRRFAVLAATNEALENVRREAFAQPSPPSRSERLRRYQGVTVPSSQIPFNWDCVSSSQTSVSQRHGESSGSRQRRSRR
ncbi:hypothetical protein IAQ61_009318 [Plenodomus lingam]|uniref:uncharacterized protein n=1 Tax=Leptosphaeria maculans TaxID=5022 RepID=UPI00332486CA|nr:hypothetical protein IAQ61_009318 [Plenodomus lingam]